MSIWNPTTSCAPRSVRGGTGLTAFVRLALAARRQRNALKKLDAAALCDLGISAAEARSEAARPAWDVPASWRR